MSLGNTARFAFRFMAVFFALEVLMCSNVLFVLGVVRTDIGGLYDCDPKRFWFTIGAMTGGALLMGALVLIMFSRRNWLRRDIEPEEASELDWRGLVRPFVWINVCNFITIMPGYDVEMSVGLVIQVILWGGIVATSYRTVSGIMRTSVRKFLEVSLPKTP